MNAVAIQGNLKMTFSKAYQRLARQKRRRKGADFGFDDKPMIIEQIKGFAEEPGWLVEGTGDIASAVSLSEYSEYNAFYYKLFVTDDGAIELRRKLKSNSKIFECSCVAMVIKGDDPAVKRAKIPGFRTSFLSLWRKIKYLPFFMMSWSLTLRINTLIWKKCFVFVFQNNYTELLEDIKDSYSGRLHSTINDGIKI